MSLFYCDICGDFEGCKKEVMEHIEESYGIDPSSDTVVEYPEVVV